MNKEVKDKLYKGLFGLKDSIYGAVRSSKNSHYNIGESLNYLRKQIIYELDDESRGLSEKTIQPIDFRIPKKNDTAIWTVNSEEARRLYNQLEPLVKPSTVKQATKTKSKISDTEDFGNKVFIVHGHDEAARESVARFVEKLGLIPVILHEQANSGKTIIEKLEEYSNVKFSIVILTPDDEGRKAGENELSTRARQNVVLELGYFIGLLGRNNVCALHKGSVEIPSDYMGVVFVPFDSSQGWKLQLAKEMKASGMEIDMNDAL